jgi:uncharacterized DUF497 family protein
MGRTILSGDGRFEWDEDKNRLNRKKHGFSFEEILEIFDDPAFLEGYNREHSGKEDRYYGIGCLNNILYIIVFYTYRKKNTPNSWKMNLPIKDSAVSLHLLERRRIISARRADSDEQEEYDGYFKKIKS